MENKRSLENGNLKLSSLSVEPSVEHSLCNWVSILWHADKRIASRDSLLTSEMIETNRNETLLALATHFLCILSPRISCFSYLTHSLYNVRCVETGNTFPQEVQPHNFVHLWKCYRRFECGSLLIKECKFNHHFKWELVETEGKLTKFPFNKAKLRHSRKFYHFPFKNFPRREGKKSIFKPLFIYLKVGSWVCVDVIFLKRFFLLQESCWKKIVDKNVKVFCRKMIL